MTDTQKVLVTDPRISKISTIKDIKQAVKSGPKTVLYKEIKPNSVNSNNIDWTMVHQSDDTLIDPSFKFKAKIKFWLRKVIADADLPIITGAPAAFPLNTITDTIVYDLNGTTHNVNLHGVREMLLKQYDQKTISTYNNTTPSYVDKLWAKFEDASTIDDVNSVTTFDSNPLSDSVNVHDDIVKRGSYPIKYRVFYEYADQSSATTVNRWGEVGSGNTVKPTEKQFISRSDAIGGVYIIQCELDVNEPLLGSPFDAFSNSQSALVGMKQLGIKLNLNNCKNVYNDYGPNTANMTVNPGVNEYAAAVMGAQTTDHPLDESCTIRLCTLNIHDSQYGSVKQQNTMPIVEYTALRTPRAVTTTASSEIVFSHVVNLGSIPDKFYLQVRLPYQDQSAGVSNFKGYPIEKVTVTMNNVGNILADRDAHELFLMSKKNGCEQTWHEFKGTLSTHATDNIESIGSYLVIDPVFDLNVGDMLTSGSMGAYQVQFNVTFKSPVAGAPYELLIMYADSSLLNTKSGQSLKEKAYLTKDEVFTVKSDPDAPHLDYQQFTEDMVGGRKKPLPLTGIGDAMRRSQGIAKAAKGGCSGGDYRVSGGASASSANSLDKYLS